MPSRIGIRREDKNKWEARVPLVPTDVKELMAATPGLEILLQPSSQRAFTDDEYRAAGARIDEDLSSCNVILAVKEIPPAFFEEGKAYLFFSHTIKGQPHNMPILRSLVARGSTLIDFERVVDDDGRRLVFFGCHAGLAGMLDTLWALGQRLKAEGFATPFAELRTALHYGSTENVLPHLRAAGEKLRAQGLPKELSPLVFGFAGYGNVSRGAQQIFDELPHEQITPEALLAGQLPTGAPLVKVVFEERHSVEPRSPGEPFALSDYFAHPEKYRSTFHRYLPHLHVLVNAILWTPRSPRLVTKAQLKELFEGAAQPAIRVIGDITCDLEGSIEATVRFTSPDSPVFVYEPSTGATPDGVEGRGPVILAVDNLPCELPQESSRDFSRALREFIPAIASADFSGEREELALPGPLDKALVLHRGALTPAYTYLQQYL